MGVEGIIGSTLSLAGSGVDAWAGHEAAEDSMHFQEKMSNSAHVREVQDLLAAGLNPVLSTKYGGASTPSGAMPPPTTFGNSAQRAAELQKQSELISQQVATLEADERNKDAQSGQAQQQADSIELRDKTLLPLEKQLLKEQIVRERNNAELSRHSAKRSEIENKFYEENPNFMLIDKYLDAGGKAVDLMNPLKKIPEGISPKPQYRKDYKRNRYDKFDPDTGEILNR